MLPIEEEVTVYLKVFQDSGMGNILLHHIRLLPVYSHLKMSYTKFGISTSTVPNHWSVLKIQ